MTDWHQDEKRECRVDELTRFDLGCRIRFTRPKNFGSSRPQVFGKLVRIVEEDYWRGNMREHGYALTIDFPSKFGDFNTDTFGPIPASTTVKLEGKWVDRKSSWEAEMDRHFLEEDTDDV